MADKNQYQAFMRAKIEGAIAEARAASTMTHQGVKGTVLEILISKLFRPLLPSDIGVGTGQVVEAFHGEMSNQMDIVLYDKSIIPPILFDESTGIFPFESVLYTIEVKTTLNPQELRVAHDSAKTLRSFGCLSGFYDEHGKEKKHHFEPPRSVVFALNSTLSGRKLTEAERYKDIYTKKKEEPYIRAICVAGKEYCYDSGSYWVNYHSQDDFDETLGFLGGVTNTYKSVAQSRGQPNLGNYIVPEITVKNGPNTKSETIVA